MSVIEIRSIFAEILWSGEAKDMRDAVEQAVRSGASLDGARLDGARLDGASPLPFPSAVLERRKGGV